MNAEHISQPITEPGKRGTFRLSGLGVTSIVIALVSVVLMLIFGQTAIGFIMFGGWLLLVLGAILGYIGLVKSGREPYTSLAGLASNIAIITVVAIISSDFNGP
jgi:hypothetical protein